MNEISSFDRAKWLVQNYPWVLERDPDEVETQSIAKIMLKSGLYAKSMRSNSIIRGLPTTIKKVRKYANTCH